MSERRYPPKPFLQGVRVLDVSRLLPGPFCSMLLADMGAEVIKIEDTQGGDYARYYPPFTDAGHGAFFEAINRNKQSVAINLKDPRGVDLFIDLAAQADVVLESFRPGVMERLGCGYEVLKQANPDLVYCAITGYGQDGPYADKAGHDLNYLALAGLLEQNGPLGEAPVPPGFQLADIAGGALYGALGITGALFQRARGEGGSFVDISMTEGALSLHIPLHGNLRAEDREQVRGGEMLTGGVPCYGVYETKDGAYLAVGALEPKFWTGFCEVAGLTGYADDGLASGKKRREVRAAVAARIAEKTQNEWVELLEGHDVCVEPVLRPTQALDAEVFQARQMFSAAQGVTFTNSPMTPTDSDHARAPTHGAHTLEVCARVLDEQTLHTYEADGVIK